MYLQISKTDIERIRKIKYISNPTTNLKQVISTLSYEINRISGIEN